MEDKDLNLFKDWAKKRLEEIERERIEDDTDYEQGLEAGRKIEAGKWIMMMKFFLRDK